MTKKLQHEQLGTIYNTDSYSVNKLLKKKKKNEQLGMQEKIVNILVSVLFFFFCTSEHYMGIIKLNSLKEHVCLIVLL